jgi:hypothetical protein
LPLPANGARERQLGWHAVPTLPEAEPFPIRQTLTAIRLGWHAVPTLPETTRSARSADPTRGRGRRFGRRLANGRDAVAPLPKAARLARSANPTRYGSVS